MSVLFSKETKDLFVITKGMNGMCKLRTTPTLNDIQAGNMLNHAGTICGWPQHLAQNDVDQEPPANGDATITAQREVL